MKFFHFLVFNLFYLFFINNKVESLNNGLGLTPQMGYNTWYDLGCSSSMNQEVVKDRARAMVELGFSQLGYIYVNLDDCWAKGRDQNNAVYPDAKTFPDGMKSLADYIHKLGLKFGIYTDRGNLTCAQRPGSLGFEKIDAQTYAAWGIDYVKEDSCFASSDHNVAFEEYGRMRDALNATGRPMFFALCGWESWYAPVGYSLGNSWRIGPDTSSWFDILENFDIESNLAAYSQPGGWNDPCLLISQSHDNHFLATPVQSRTQFNMWSILSAPLIISGNIRNLTQFNYETYTNAEVIAIDQDPLAKQGIRLVGKNLRPNDQGKVFMDDCSLTSPSQQWVFNKPMNQFMFNSFSNLCLNVANCQSDVIGYPCVTHGGTCSGPNSYANEQWTLTSKGQLQSLFNHQCLTIQPDFTLELANCMTPIPNNQSFTYNSQTNQLKNPSNKCLSAPLPPDTTNIWGRELFDGSWAVVFLNNGNETASLTCDYDSCFSKMKFSSSTVLLIRDLWQHKFIGTTVASSGYTVRAPPLGDSIMLRFYPQK